LSGYPDNRGKANEAAIETRPEAAIFKEAFRVRA